MIEKSKREVYLCLAAVSHAKHEFWEKLFLEQDLWAVLLCFTNCVTLNTINAK